MRGRKRKIAGERGKVEICVQMKREIERNRGSMCIGEGRGWQGNGWGGS